MKNSELKFKCFIKNKSIKNAQIFDMNDVNRHPMNIPHFDIALPFVYMQDANKVDIYAGDVLCLAITDELMDINKDGFAASNLGKHIKEHPDITEVYLAICPPAEPNVQTVPFNYKLYFTHNHKIERWDDDDTCDNSIKCNCNGEDTMFPKYIAYKGATIVANLYEMPDFLNNL